MLAYIRELHLIADRRGKLAEQLVSERRRHCQDAIEVDYNLLARLYTPDHIDADLFRKISTAEHLSIFLS